MTLKEERLTELRTKLAARAGKPGFGINAAAIKEQIAQLESGATQYRSEITGRFVDLSHLIQNPQTTEEA